MIKINLSFKILGRIRNRIRVQIEMKRVWKTGPKRIHKNIKSISKIDWSVVTIDDLILNLQ